jgi:long-chain acyl-CoA synthetase
MNIAQNIEHSRQRDPHKTALIFEETAYTYQELDQMVNRLANGLQKLSVRSGDRVALFLPNIPAFVISYLATQKIGAIAVSVNSMLKENEVRFILEDCGAVVLITTETMLADVPLSALPALQIIVAEGEAGSYISWSDLLITSSSTVVAVSVDENTPAALVYSSGTTGFPKGVTLSHGNVVSNIQAKNNHCGMKPEDKAILFVPLFHCFGQNAVMNSIFEAGGTVVLHRSFNFEAVLASIDQEQITMFFAVPTIYILLLQRASKADFTSVRYFFSAAATLPEEIARRWHEQFGKVINVGYGLTETTPFASYNHTSHYKFGSIGTPIERVSMKIVSVDNGRELSTGQLGEIVIRGPNVMLGYWNQPDATARAIRDGWLHTGDIGKMDDDGYFYIMDRVKDMINVAGMKVYPIEVENVIYQHPSVAEVAVYGVPDPITEEQVMASIVLKGGQTPSKGEILAMCRKQLANFKVPVSVKFVTSLPKNSTGKIIKRRLRETAID